MIGVARLFRRNDGAPDSLNGDRRAVYGSDSRIGASVADRKTAGGGGCKIEGDIIKPFNGKVIKSDRLRGGVYRQDRCIAGNAAGGIGNYNAIFPGLGNHNVVQRQCRIGLTNDVLLAFAPLVAQRRDTVGSDAECSTGFRCYN